MNICNNTVLAIGIVTVGAVAIASLVTGHNHVMESIGVIATMAGGAPHLNAFYKKSPTTPQ